ncbi:hypothetical protein CPter91_3841 [Collimonas pratensis]|uniref:Uncharacterized protein n=1 Tax=Collimonas pratensis TaxID=279113 RepID=A0A127Q976_9BURK|nr:hypothetical protein CPter91_3841 [Collimonas pratensis]
MRVHIVQQFFECQNHKSSHFFHFPLFAISISLYLIRHSPFSSTR